LELPQEALEPRLEDSSEALLELAQETPSGNSSLLLLVEAQKQL
jgi:hypothetical protein